MKIIKVIAVILFLGISFFYISCFSSIVMPWQKEEAIEAALSWGQLEKLPDDAEFIHIEKRGSMFTRQFIIEFTSSESQIKKWMLKSKGFKKSTLEIKNKTKIFQIHPKELQSYGGKVEITGNKVLINMSWS
ncbi:hypothetical protein [Flavobacterium sp. KACC 22761]|uniref:hypothetical protein n=1 Tax=Flavobacterium sp. KACC 22761 TaxID=3092665 RepID=UPI002A75C4FB|nr:hypothetical protein [Flavobacterium sp. KACC 22761]WPO77704.1 hypothetical protein SCB73_15655 [Flavobacterium sp. KACC 22761]